MQTLTSQEVFAEEDANFTAKNNNFFSGQIALSLNAGYERSHGRFIKLSTEPL